MENERRVKGVKVEKTMNIAKVIKLSKQAGQGLSLPDSIEWGLKRIEGRYTWFVTNNEEHYESEPYDTPEESSEALRKYLQYLQKEWESNDT